MFQNPRVTAFTVSELLREKQKVGREFLPRRAPRLRLGLIELKNIH